MTDQRHHEDTPDFNTELERFLYDVAHDPEFENLCDAYYLERMR